MTIKIRMTMNNSNKVIKNNNDNDNPKLCSEDRGSRFLQKVNTYLPDNTAHNPGDRNLDSHCRVAFNPQSISNPPW
jgi:hypothetical protein